MREKLYPQVTNSKEVRITPACAGKTQTYQNVKCKSWDHPRVCGKNVRNVLRVIFGMGSPPRVREKLEATLDSRLTGGITPACAGKT